MKKIAICSIILGIVFIAGCIGTGEEEAELGNNTSTEVILENVSGSLNNTSTGIVFFNRTVKTRNWTLFELGCSDDYELRLFLEDDNSIVLGVFREVFGHCEEQYLVGRVNSGYYVFLGKEYMCPDATIPEDYTPSAAYVNLGKPEYGEYNIYLYFCDRTDIAVLLRTKGTLRIQGIEKDIEAPPYESFSLRWAND